MAYHHRQHDKFNFYVCENLIANFYFKKGFLKLFNEYFMPSGLFA